MREYAQEFRLRSMCRVFGLHPSGYYAWLGSPLSERGKDDLRVLGMIKHCWLESDSVYGYRKITRDLRDLGELCGKHRIARLMRRESLRAQVGYGRRPRYRRLERCQRHFRHTSRQQARLPMIDEATPTQRPVRPSPGSPAPGPHGSGCRWSSRYRSR